MRDKRRYLLIEAAEPVASAEAERSIYKELVKVIGEVDYAMVNPRIISFIDGKRFVIRSSLDGQGMLVLAFAFMRSLDGKPNAFYTLGASGTIRALGKNSGHVIENAKQGK